jgi:hypothetical protein
VVNGSSPLPLTSKLKQIQHLSVLFQIHNHGQQGVKVVNTSFRGLAMGEKKFVTVGALAKELGKPIGGLLKLLEAAGKPKQSSRSRIDEQDQQALLDFLKSQNMQSVRPRKKLQSQAQALIIDVQNSKNGSEYAALMYLSELVIRQVPVESKFQNLVNLIVSKALLLDSLPLKLQGRPKNQRTVEIGRRVTERYFTLLDQGFQKSEAVTQVADEFSKEQRQIFRYIKKHRDEILNPPRILIWQNASQINDLVYGHYRALTEKLKHSDEVIEKFTADPIGYIDARLKAIPTL